MIRIGLTGGIGAGKSTVARELAALGGAVVDSDRIAREVVEPGTPGLAALVEAFGETILAEDGSLDRPALAAVAFADDESRKRLNAITHPLVGARAQEVIDAAGPDAVVVQDIPLLVEGGLAPAFHLVIVVWADAEERVQRLVTQRGMSEEDARARIAAQATDEQRRAVADVWLDNSGAPAAMPARVRELWERRIAPFAANLAAGRPAGPGSTSSGGGASGAVADADRRAARVRLALGQDAAVDVASGVVEVTPVSGVDAAALAPRFAAAGFYPVAGGYAGADPGVDTPIRIRPNA
ncbi:dephospho-CoA kinase [Tsukamurella sp. 8F]|uniref:dephospho-CoA kinase n=1 Tax=unclassified Tsukamurella TaxID=2633480 RepID=UPI0023B8BCD7|nr:MULTISPECIES: dephospho-CoA kinase [unclassified Tsukamurella]MDF0528692.1 dephospho-CoA kinase [Tsukamurella sp. 8J]MDF0585654.1 dephospho-CoA kinase [Tsukamurella sp. 8F]